MTINSWGSDEPVEATKGGTGQSTYATGDILYASGANTWSKLAAGTDGHVLTLAAGVPSWAAASGGGGAWVFLNAQTASNSSSINFDRTYITSTYDVYAIIWHNYQPVSDSDILLRFSPDNGSTIRSSGYDSEAYDEGGTTSSADTTAIRATRADVGGSTDEGHGILIYYVAFPASASIKTQGSAVSGYYDSANAIANGSGYGKYDTAETHNYFRFLASTGNIDTGTVYLYGLAKS